MSSQYWENGAITPLDFRTPFLNDKFYAFLSATELDAIVDC